MDFDQENMEEDMYEDDDEDMDDFADFLEDQVIQEQSKTQSTLPITPEFYSSGNNNINILGINRLCLLAVNNRLIFLLGENHDSYDKPCTHTMNSTDINVVDFLDYFFTRSSICCDFFLEQYQFISGSKDTDKIYQNFIRNLVYTGNKKSSMNLLLQRYRECFQSLDKSACPRYGNVRMHNIEYRRHTVYSNDDIHQVNLEPGPEFVHSTRLSNARLVLEYRKILVLLLENKVLQALNALFNLQGIKMGMTEQEFYTNQTKYSKLSKQLYPLPSNVKTDLLSFYDTFSKHYQEKESKTELLVSLPALIMDCYTLARILKVTYVYQDSGILFVYAGGFHINHYYWFLTNKIPTCTRVLNVSSDRLSSCVQLSNQDQEILVNTLEKFFQNEAYRQSQCLLKNARTST